MSTPFESGATTETREGINIVRAASAVGVSASRLFVGAGADRATGIPHFDSKFAVEQEIRRRACRSRSIAPVFFMENFLADWLAPGIAKGSIGDGIAATRRLQQIASRISRSSTPSSSNAVRVSSVNESTSRLTS